MDRARLVRTISLIAFLLCFGVVVLGAYVRLSNAGLGCPDWPGCYGHLTPAGAASAPVSLAEYAARPLQIGKAWREMVHRYAAATLGILIVLLTAMGIVWRRQRVLPTAYVSALLGIVVAQGILGMLTVTWLLKPPIVTMHLLFGLTTLSLLWWLVLTLWRQHNAWPVVTARSAAGLSAIRTLALIGLVVLGCQIFLGGWTSSNYAALACPDVPTCQGAWWPHANFRAAFVLWHPLRDIDYQGGVLASPVRVAIQLTHRMGAVVTTLVLVSAALVALRRGMRPLVRVSGVFVLAMLALQLTIGVSMVLRGFPLWLATAHNAGAALLLLAVLTLNRAVYPRPAPCRSAAPGSVSHIA